jgi:ABC-2 type transport system ATP-binding protein
MKPILMSSLVASTAVVAPISPGTVGPSIEVEEFTKVYNGFTAVHNLTFSACPGEVLGILGANGAGKTTLLRALTGILQPTAGVLRVGGVDIELNPVAAKHLFAYIPDTSQPYELLTVGEHLQFTALAYRLADASLRFDAVLNEVGLTAKKHALAATLSRGMKQKLSLACAFLRNPPIIILDEPLTGLDPVAIRDVKESITRRAANGTTFLLSSHLLDLLEKLCDRVLIMDRGRKVGFGPLDEIRATANMPGNADLEDVFFAVTKAQSTSEETRPS